MTDPIKWKDMTTEQKGALLLADYEGKVIQSYEDHEWYDVAPVWRDLGAYRVKPEPVVEVVKVMVYCKGKHVSVDSGLLDPTHRITFNLIDGKPD